MTRRTLPILLAVVVSLVFTAPAMGRNLYKQIIEDYLRSGNTITACKFTTSELKQAKNAIPADLRQYGAALIAALDDAIAARAQGACDKKKQNATAPAVATQTAPPVAPPPPGAPSSSAGSPAVTPGVPPPAQAPPTPTAEPSPATAIAGDDSIALASHVTGAVGDPPVPVVLLAILAGLLALGALLFALVRWRAWDPAWGVRLRHAAGEAGWRASSTFAEFTDFVRLGR